jgi:predicted dinucleotide-binding enzyme
MLLTKKAPLGTSAEAAAFGELVIIDTLWDIIVNAIEFANPTKNFMGKIVIDVTKHLDFSKTNVSNPLLDNFCT